MDAIEDGEALACLRRRDDWSGRGQVRQDLDPSPTSVIKGSDADSGVAKDALEVGNPPCRGDVRGPMGVWGRIRPDEEKPCAREARRQGPRDKLRRLLIWYVIEVPNEHDVAGFKGI